MPGSQRGHDPRAGLARAASRCRARRRAPGVLREAAGLHHRRGGRADRPGTRGSGGFGAARLHEAVRPGGSRRPRFGSRHQRRPERRRDRPSPHGGFPSHLRPRGAASGPTAGPGAGGSRRISSGAWRSAPWEKATTSRSGGRTEAQGVSSLAHDLSVIRSLRQRPLNVEHADVWRQSSRFAVRDGGRDRGSFGDHPPSIQATGGLPGGGRYTLAWHYLPDFPAYRETVRVVHGRGSVELVFPSPYLMHAPTELRVTSLDGEAESTVVRRSTDEAFESQLEAFARMIRDGAEPYLGLAEGREDILFCQSVVSRIRRTYRVSLPMARSAL